MSNRTIVLQYQVEMESPKTRFLVHFPKKKLAREEKLANRRVSNAYRIEIKFRRYIDGRHEASFHWTAVGLYSCDA